MKTICYGELMIDLTAEGQEPLEQASSFQKHAGGAAANVAAQLVKLGDEACFLGKIGDDVFGRYLLAYMKRLRIDTEMTILDPARRTTVAFVGLDEKRVPEYLFYRTGGASETLRQGEIDPQKLHGADVLYTSSLMLTTPVVRQTTMWLLAYARRAGLRTAFDMNLRKTAWESLADAHNVMVLALHEVDILKINEDELVFLTGQAQADAGMEQLFAAYPTLSVILVTCGENGAYLRRRDEALVRIEPHRVHAVDTTGAGDSFMGAFLHAYCGGKEAQRELRRAGEFAARAAEMTVQSAGTIDSMPNLKDLYDSFGNIDKKV